MEFLAMLWLGHQACENDQLDHLRTPLSPSRLPSGYAITAALESRVRCALVPGLIEQRTAIEAEIARRGSIAERVTGIRGRLATLLGGDLAQLKETGEPEISDQEKAIYWGPFPLRPRASIT